MMNCVKCIRVLRVGLLMICRADFSFFFSDILIRFLLTVIILDERDGTFAVLFFYTANTNTTNYISAVWFNRY